MSKKNIIKETIRKYIPQHHMTSLRIMYRICMETVYGIKRTGFLNIAIIAAMAAILSIFGALMRTGFSLSSFVENLGNNFEISVYLKNDAESEYMATRLKDIEHVKKVTIITKEEAWADMNAEMDVSGMANPLPDTLHVTVDSPDNITNVCDELKKVQGIEDMSYARDMAKKLQTVTNAFNTVTVIVLGIVALLTVVIINSTIQLVIKSRQEEIEIMRLMGVSNWYIRIPLILQGAAYGFFGAVIALIPLNALQNMLVKFHAFVNVAPPESALRIVVVLLFIMAIFFSAGGSLFSIKKHLQV